MSITNINAKKPPVIYSVRIAQHFDGHLEFFVEDVADDQRSHASVAWALRQMADVLDKDKKCEHCLGECIATEKEPAMWKCPASEKVLKAAYHALRSYQHGNAATELAKGAADGAVASLANGGVPAEYNEQHERNRHDAEELEALHMCLDKRGIPRSDAAGAVYSAWGRVLRYVAPRPTDAEILEAAKWMLYPIKPCDENIIAFVRRLETRIDSGAVQSNKDVLQTLIDSAPAATNPRIEGSRNTLT